MHKKIYTTCLLSITLFYTCFAFCAASSSSSSSSSSTSRKRQAPDVPELADDNENYESLEKKQTTHAKRTVELTEQEQDALLQSCVEGCCEAHRKNYAQTFNWALSERNFPTMVWAYRQYHVYDDSSQQNDAMKKEIIKEFIASEQTAENTLHFLRMILETKPSDSGSIAMLSGLYHPSHPVMQWILHNKDQALQKLIQEYEAEIEPLFTSPLTIAPTPASSQTGPLTSLGENKLESLTYKALEAVAKGVASGDILLEDAERAFSAMGRPAKIRAQLAKAVYFLLPTYIQYGRIKPRMDLFPRELKPYFSGVSVQELLDHNRILSFSGEHDAYEDDDEIEENRFKSLDLSGMEINDLNGLDRIQHIQRLDLSNNRLTKFESSVLKNPEDLEDLLLYYNEIKPIDLIPNAFKDLKNLKLLEIDFDSPVPGMFAHLNSLEKLYLHKVDSEATLPAGVFHGLNRLDYLYIDNKNAQIKAAIATVAPRARVDQI